MDDDLQAVEEQERDEFEQYLETGRPMRRPLTLEESTAVYMDLK